MGRGGMTGIPRRSMSPRTSSHGRHGCTPRRGPPISAPCRSAGGAAVLGAWARLQAQACRDAATRVTEAGVLETTQCVDERRPLRRRMGVQAAVLIAAPHPHRKERRHCLMLHVATRPRDGHEVRRTVVLRSRIAQRARMPDLGHVERQERIARATNSLTLHRSRCSPHQCLMIGGDEEEVGDRDRSGFRHAQQTNDRHSEFGGEKVDPS